MTNIDDRYWERIYFQQSKNWWWEGKEKIIELFLNRYGRLSKSSKILDIGCGPGFMVKLLNAYGRGFGIDIFDPAMNFYRRQGLNRLVKASAEHLPFKEKTFDGITLIDSLEHMEDDKGVISECCRTIKANGFLLLIVPAYKALWTKRDIYFGHKKRYSYAALKRLWPNSGLSVEKISHTNLFLLPIIFFLSIFEKITNSKIMVNNEGVQNFHPLLNEFLYRLLEMEAHLLNKISLPFGSSIVCLARKTSP